MENDREYHSFVSEAADTWRLNPVAHMQWKFLQYI
jgi:hypothetical protein